MAKQEDDKPPVYHLDAEVFRNEPKVQHLDVELIRNEPPVHHHVAEEFHHEPEVHHLDAQVFHSLPWFERSRQEPKPKPSAEARRDGTEETPVTTDESASVLALEPWGDAQDGSEYLKLTNERRAWLETLGMDASNTVERARLEANAAESIEQRAAALTSEQLARWAEVEAAHGHSLREACHSVGLDEREYNAVATRIRRYNAARLPTPVGSQAASAARGIEGAASTPPAAETIKLDAEITRLKEEIAQTLAEKKAAEADKTLANARAFALAQELDAARAEVVDEEELRKQVREELSAQLFEEVLDKKIGEEFARLEQQSREARQGEEEKEEPDDDSNVDEDKEEAGGTSDAEHERQPQGQGSPIWDAKLTGDPVVDPLTRGFAQEMLENLESWVAEICMLGAHNQSWTERDFRNYLTGVQQHDPERFTDLRDGFADGHPRVEVLGRVFAELAGGGTVIEASDAPVPTAPAPEPETTAPPEPTTKRPRGWARERVHDYYRQCPAALNDKTKTARAVGEELKVDHTIVNDVRRELRAAASTTAEEGTA